MYLFHRGSKLENTCPLSNVTRFSQIEQEIVLRGEISLRLKIIKGKVLSEPSATLDSNSLFLLHRSL